MRTYCYAPSVNVYAAVRGRNGDTYYDLSEDIVSCIVNRVTDTYSSFSITLMNKQLKYNNLFSPFDRIAIVANKDGNSYRLLTGYITKTDVFTLFETNFKIEGKDTLYRLSQLYFDPNLHETRKLLAESTPNQIDNEGWARLHTVLTKIAGWPESMIDISRSIPMNVVTWAKELYVAQKSDYEQSEQIISDMFGAIVNSSVGMSYTTNDVFQNASQMASAGAGSDDSSGVTGAIVDSTATDKQKAVVSAAYSTPSPGAGWCAAWVSNVFSNAGIGSFGGNACDMYNSWCNSSNKSNLKTGMIIAVNTHSHTGPGRTYGHVGIYVGNSTVRDNIGNIRDINVDEWINFYDTTVTPKWGWLGGVALA